MDSWQTMPKQQILVSIGAALQGMRLQLDLSQAELAVQAGITPAMLSRIELGKVNPSFLVLLSLLRALGRADDLQTIFATQVSPLQLATGKLGRERASGKNKRKATTQSSTEKAASAQSVSLVWKWGEDEK